MSDISQDSLAVRIGARTTRIQCAIRALVLLLLSGSSTAILKSAENSQSAPAQAALESNSQDDSHGDVTEARRATGSREWRIAAGDDDAHL